MAADVAGQLVAINPAFLGQWQGALRPVADRLVPPLANILADPQQGELPRSLATSLFADYAQNDVTALTNIVVDADAKAFDELFPVLQQHGRQAVAQLQAVLDRKVEPTWKDSPLDPAWKEVTPEVRVAIEAAHGMIAERFAFCQTMPWNTFSASEGRWKPADTGSRGFGRGPVAISVWWPPCGRGRVSVGYCRAV